MANKLKKTTLDCHMFSVQILMDDFINTVWYKEADISFTIVRLFPF